MSTTGLTLLLPFAELCLRQVPRGRPVPLGALQKLPGGAKGLCAQPGQLPLAEQRGVISASGLVRSGTSRASRPCGTCGGLNLVQGPVWTPGPVWTLSRGAVVPKTVLGGRVVFPRFYK